MSLDIGNIRVAGSELGRRQYKLVSTYGRSRCATHFTVDIGSNVVDGRGGSQTAQIAQVERRRRVYKLSLLYDRVLVATDCVPTGKVIFGTSDGGNSIRNSIVAVVFECNSSQIAIVV